MDAQVRARLGIPLARVAHVFFRKVVAFAEHSLTILINSGRSLGLR